MIEASDGTVMRMLGKGITNRFSPEPPSNNQSLEHDQKKKTKRAKIALWFIRRYLDFFS
jgi:hypothetical protein